MLLKKKIWLYFVLFSLFILILPSAYSQQTCTAAEIKDSLRKALFEFFEAPSNSKLSVNEIKDFLHFYISIDSNQLTTDCSGSGPLSGKPYYLMLGTARNIDIGIPKCGDGTEYGRCSSNVPNYCYGGKLEERCKLCGCGLGQTCDTKANKCISSGSPTEPIPPIQTLANPPQITSISPSSGTPNTKITLTGSGFTATGNSINWGNQLNAIRELSSTDGKTLTFSALQMQCPRKTCLVSVTNTNGTSNSVTFNLTHRPVKTKHKGKPTVQVLTPNGGERFVSGKDKINITWSGGLESVALYVSNRYWEPDNGEFAYSADWYIIAKDLQPSGSFEWNGKVCNWLDANDCRQSYPGFQKILALSEDRPNEQLTYETIYDPEHDNWDESDNTFLAVTPATISSLEVTSPNGEEKWIQDVMKKDADGWGLKIEGTIAPFEWKTANFATNSDLYGQIYSINVLKGGKFYSALYSGFMYQYPNWNRFDLYYTLPNYTMTGNDYTVEIIFHGPNGDIKDVSDKTFSVGTVPGVAAVRGKLIDKFTNVPSQLPDGYHFWSGVIYPGTRSDGTKLSAILTNFWNGNFAFGMATDDASISTQRAFYARTDAVSLLPIWVSKKPDNTYEVLADVMDQSPQPLRADVINSEANLGRINAWTAGALSVSTDVPVTYSVQYEQDGLSKTGSATPTQMIYPMESYPPYFRYYLIPLNYNTRVKVVDNAGKEYYSPYINLGLEYTRGGASLIFKNGTIKWNIPPNIHVIYPDGGNQWFKSGATETIRWECVNWPPHYPPCNPYVDIYLTGGSSEYYYDFWGTYFHPGKLIATTRGTSYNWTIPADATGYHRIFVITPYTYYFWGRDYSDKVFGIS